ncbi:MAG: hypothetical protein R2830_25110 [Saprospiraceae bacterium]
MKQLPFFILLISLFSACKKDPIDSNPGTNGQTYMSAKLNGDLVKTWSPSGLIMKAEISAQTKDTLYSLLISGIETGSNFNQLKLGLGRGIPPEIGAYTDKGDCMALEGCAGIYYEVVKNGNTVKDYGSNPTLGSAANINFSILEFKSKGRVKGSFSGVIFEKDTDERMEVTEGEFDTYIQ